MTWARPDSLGRLAATLVLAATALACTGAPVATPAGTPAVTIDIAAQNIAFDRDILRAPANVPFAIRFENREAAEHNVSIRGDAPLFVGELFGGPETRTYLVPAIPAGEYTFVCDLHPNMTGTFLSE